MSEFQVFVYKDGVPVFAGAGARFEVEFISPSGVPEVSACITINQFGDTDTLRI